MPGINNGGVANYLTLGVRMLCSLLVLSLRGVQFPSAERVGSAESCRARWFCGITAESGEASSKPLSDGNKDYFCLGVVTGCLSATSLASCLFGASWAPRICLVPAGH